MSKHSVEMKPNAEQPHTPRVGLPCLIVLLVLTLAVVAFNRLVPKVANGGQGSTARVGWYLRSGQWHADVRTLVAAFEFVMTPDSSAPAGTNSPTNRLAMALSLPNLNPSGISPAKGGGVYPANTYRARRVESSLI